MPLLASPPSPPCPPVGHPSLAEIFYDAAGDDTDREFVELSNPSDSAFVLAGVRLESGDGSGPGRWTQRFRGAPGDTIPARGRFVIGGARVVPAPDRIALLDLQNGPDAVRLVWPDGAIETVGYGAHEFAEYFCGSPAEDVASGLSLARVPDDAASGANALDFRAASPSPGRANQPRRDLAAVPRSLTLDPVQPSVGAQVRARFAAVNRGAEAWPKSSAVASAWLGDDRLASTALDVAIAAAETVWVALDGVAARDGKWSLVVRVEAPGDEDPEDDADSLAVRVGPGPLAIGEIQFHPRRGEGEWVEVRNRALAPLDPTGFRIGDRGSLSGSVRGAPPVLPAESLGVFVQDRAGFLGHFQALDTTRVWEVRPWAALNNSDDAAGIADEVRIGEVDGTPVDHVAYQAAGVPDGTPIERRDPGGWFPATVPDGTPLAPPRILPPLPASFAVRPRRVAAGAGAVQLEWSLPWPAAIAIDAYDLAGRRVAPVLRTAAMPARGESSGSIAGLAPGCYVLALVARGASGATIAASQALRIDGVAP